MGQLLPEGLLLLIPYPPCRCTVVPQGCFTQQKACMAYDSVFNGNTTSSYGQKLCYCLDRLVGTAGATTVPTASHTMQASLSSPGDIAYPYNEGTSSQGFLSVYEPKIPGYESTTLRPFAPQVCAQAQMDVHQPYVGGWDR